MNWSASATLWMRSSWRIVVIEGLPGVRSCCRPARGAARPACGISRSTAAIASAESRNVMWITVCQNSVFSVNAWALMNVLQQVDRRDADDRGRELDLQHARVDVRQPFRLVRMALEAHARHERLVAADDHHDEQVADHDHVDQAEHDQHGQRFPRLDLACRRPAPRRSRGCARSRSALPIAASTRCTSSTQNCQT